MLAHHGNRSARLGVARSFSAAIIVAFALLIIPSSASAGAISVSYPGDPIPVVPGKMVATSITVANPGKTPVDVVVTTSRVSLGDNGALGYSPGVDPLFAGNVTIVPATLHLPPNARRDVRITVRPPAGLQPDFYFLGFLVTPAAAGGGNIKVVNRIGALVVLDVPGPRGANLSAALLGFPAVVWGSPTVKGVVRAKNTGISTVAFTTTTSIPGFVKARPDILRDIPRLLPPGLYRDVPVSWSSWLGLGWYTVNSRLVYNISQLRTKGVDVSQRVYVIFWPWLFTPVAIVAVIVWLALRRVRKQRLRREAEIFGPSA